MDFDIGEEIERAVSDPCGDHTFGGLREGLDEAPQLRRSHSLSALQRLEAAVFDIEDR